MPSASAGRGGALRRGFQRWTWLVLIGGALALAACAGPSPMSELFRPDVYTVRQGDTLYAIAWRYERSVEDLIRWNDLDAPDTLYPGQRLVLAPPGDAGPVAGRGTGSGGASSKAESGGAPASPAPADTDPDEARGAADAGHQSGDGGAPGDWRWPSSGELVGTFTDGRVHGRGIDIAGTEGQGVAATAAGEVVYSGEGLQAYGPLIIIRHSSEYLSAYAHNRRLLVDEGEHVEAGEHIAEMGIATGEGPLLHFEIRRDGRPVDPLDYLPARE